MQNKINKISLLNVDVLTINKGYNGDVGIYLNSTPFVRQCDII